VFKKLRDGSTSARDLFTILDAEGDGSGDIGENEFKTLTRRLGMPLSNHRITEIFAITKGPDFDNPNLEEDEFMDALGSLKEKQVDYSLDFIGISPT